MKAIRTATLAALASFTIVAGPASAEAIVLVQNRTVQTIHPWFKTNCWGPLINGVKNEWTFFGAIHGGGQFGWDFAEAGFLDPRCRHPKVVFTYTNDPSPPADPLPKHMKFKFRVVDGTNVDPIRVGVGVQGPDTNEEDDD